MNLLSKITQTLTNKSIIIAGFFALLFIVCLADIYAQNNKVFTIKADTLDNNRTVKLSKAGWKYKAGDDLNWANSQFDDSAWETLEESSLNADLLKQTDWNGRGWFRLHFKVDENLADKTFALVAAQRGAAEVYIDGKKLASFGEISDSDITEYNPAGTPIPFNFEKDGEHVLAVRFASEAFADPSSLKVKWMTNGKIYPGFTYYLKDADDVQNVIEQYSKSHSMSGAFLFIGVLLALALLHFLLYLFYRVERGNLFYSIYAAALAFFLVCGNYVAFGHQPIFPSLIINQINRILFAFVFISLLAFLHVAFGRRLRKLFWILTGLWAVKVIISLVFLNKFPKIEMMQIVLMTLTFIFCVYILVQSLRKKRPGAWILMIGLQLFLLGMLSVLVNELDLLNLPGFFYGIGELILILSIPLAVSFFLARNFANTNRNLKTQLEQVELLSKQQIEQERRTAELHAENERRAQEFEEARQLQLSMLPKKLPNIAGLEIAAYMKPATEVGGDYYDFHTGDDGTLTVAVGDATGHGLKAGTVVTATKSLFNVFADEQNIPQVFNRMSGALKAMNLRGLFMAMTMLKIKNNQVILSSAGMPSALVYRSGTNSVEEIPIKAMPLGSMVNFLGIAASSLENAKAHRETSRFNFQLNEKVQGLRALLDLVRGLTSTLEPDEVARLLILTLTGRWAVGKYALFVQKENHLPIERHKRIVLPAIETFREIVSELPEAVLVDYLPDGEFKDALIKQKAELVFPIRSSDSTAGVFVLGSRLGKTPYAISDLEFGAGLVAQAGVALENSWYVLETIERKKMEQELQLAASIQEGLFPEFLPHITGYDIAAKNRPALQCGGDYYDVLPIERIGDAGEKSYLLCVADVSGKGLAASLLMSNMQATMRALLGRIPSLVELASLTNKLLYATTPSNKFITAILFEVFPDSGKAIYVSAGHGDCLLLRNTGEVEKFDSTGLPLGMMDGDMLEMLGKGYEEKHIELNSGDLLALYSDGVTEAYDIEENEWGDERLLNCLRPILGSSSENIVSKVFETIDDFAQTAPQHDDITLMIIKRGT